MVGTQNQKCFRKFGKLVTKVLTVILTFEDPHPPLGKGLGEE